MPTQSTTRIVVDVLTALSVVLGLVFVGLELRHANNLARADALNSINALYLELNYAKYEAPASTGLWAAYYAGELEGKESLPPEDYEAIENFISGFMTVFESAWQYHSRGIIGDEEFDGYLRGLCSEFSQAPFLPEVWRTQRHAYSAGAIAEGERACPNLATD